MKEYNKLVRDKIPEIIRNSGKDCTIRRAEDDEYYRLLQEKLSEEVKEFLDSDSPEELADILEVMKALASTKGISWGKVESLAEEKVEERGAFSERIVLEAVFDK